MDFETYEKIRLLEYCKRCQLSVNASMSTQELGDALVQAVSQRFDPAIGQASLFTKRPDTLIEEKSNELFVLQLQIELSQLKFLYPLKTLVFPAFSPPRFGPFPSFFPLREEMRETFFRPSPTTLSNSLAEVRLASLWWRGRKCSLWYLHQNVPAAPAHPWVRLREREGWSYMYVSTDGSENHPYPPIFFREYRHTLLTVAGAS